MKLLIDGSHEKNVLQVKLFPHALWQNSHDNFWWMFTVLDQTNYDMHKIKRWIHDWIPKSIWIGYVSLSFTVFYSSIRNTVPNIT